MGLLRKITYAGIGLNLLATAADLLGGGSPVQDAIEAAMLTKLIGGVPSADGKATTPEEAEQRLRALVDSLGK